jgi:two-component system, sensor histidine kinase and response regulator
LICRFEAARVIKADPVCTPIHAVLLAATGRRGNGERARRAGIEGYLMKPVRESLLHECLSTVLTVRDTQAGTPVLITRHTLNEACAAARPRILVVDVDVMNQKVMTRMLKALGYHADIVADGREAVDAILQGLFAMVLMDSHMDGLAAAARIRSNQGREPPTPIVAVTADATQDNRDRLLTAGMDDYLAKPVMYEDLKRVLDRWVRTQSSDRVPVQTPVAMEPYDRLVIERDVINELRGLDGGRQLLRIVIDHFLDEAPARLKALREAAASSNARAVSHIAQFMNSNSRNLGARRMQVLCDELESLAEGGHISGANGLIVELEHAFEDARKRLMIEREALVGTAGHEGRVDG